MSKADRLLIRFAKFCIKQEIDPDSLTKLRAATRKAENAIVRLEVTGVGDASKYCEKVEALAADCRLPVQWNSVHPEFIKNGHRVYLP